jgi:hypothetical protein
MITTVVGKTFLDAYNAKYQTSLSAKQFFEEVYFELFYNHPKYMQWVTNSPFVQGITTSDDGEYGKELKKVKSINSELLKNTIHELQNLYSIDRVLLKTDKSKGVIKILLKNDEIQRNERLNKLIELVQENKTDGSIALGFPAASDETYASTSGQVSDLLIPVSNDDVYLSWIGSGLGIIVAGGYSILFDDPIITLQTFEGWKVYRKYLNDDTLQKLKGNQINTWNGQWLKYSLGSSFRKDFDFSRLTDEKIFAIDSQLIKVDTINWPNLYFILSYMYPNGFLNSFVYSIGDVNKTIGFIPFYLKSGNRIKEVYKLLFDGDYNTVAGLFGIDFKRACELGQIGLQALRPKDLEKYYNNNKNISFKKQEDTIIYHAYKTWLITMLTKNKEEFKDYTLSLAEIILRYRNSGTKNDRKNLVENDLFASKSKRTFIEHLTTMVKDLAQNDLLIIKNLKDEIHLMTNEEFGYFSTLLKFDYAFIEKQS